MSALSKIVVFECYGCAMDVNVYGTCLLTGVE